MNIPTITTDPVMSIICIIIIVVASFIIVQIDNYAVMRMNRFKKDLTAAYLLRDIVKFATYFVAFMIILQFFGINLGGTLLSLGIIGIAVSLAAQEILSNLFSGIILILGNTLKSGDKVEINNKTGIVKGISIISTKLIDDTGDTLVVPNSSLTNNTYIRYKPNDECRVDIIVGLPLDMDLEEFREYIIERILSYDGVDSNKTPRIFAKEIMYEESKIKVSFWIKEYSTRDEYKLIIANEIRKYLDRGANNEKSTSRRNIRIES
jgi:small-conductance mechanosensitive channel